MTGVQTCALPIYLTLTSLVSPFLLTTPPMRFEVACDCERYTPFRFAWVNRLGGVDSYTFRLKSKRTVDITRKEYTRYLSRYIEATDRYGYSVGDRGRQLYDVRLVLELSAVALAAVVGKQDEKWGETPCAFIQLKPGENPTADEIIAFCRDQVAHYKAPRTVVFGPLPTTATGKIQKFTLRERARALRAG